MYICTLRGLLPVFLISHRNDDHAQESYHLFKDRSYFWLHQHAMKKELKEHSQKLDEV